METNIFLNNEELKQVNPKNTININIGVLGHIDSGKTSLARVLTRIASTASLDKNPQSQERGITLDLGFSAFFTRIPVSKSGIYKDAKYFQFTLVDCPGHASLIKTVIGGAQIIDLMLLIIDVNKGIQTQTAECLVIAEVLIDKMILVLNKIDMIAESERQTILTKKSEALRKMMGRTKFGSNLPIVNISARPGGNPDQLIPPLNIDQLIQTIVDNISVQKRAPSNGGLLYMIDHCFTVKGQGTVTTGTVLQGSIKPGDEIYFPEQNISKKVKSMQMFKRQVEYAGPGDRVASLFVGLDANQIERTIACQVGMVQPAEHLVLTLNRITYYKGQIKSNAKFHITSGHQTVMGQLKLFIRPKNSPILQEEKKEQNLSKDVKIFQDDGSGFDGEFIEDIQEYNEFKQSYELYALIELETPLLITKGALVLASKLDTDLEANICRFAFWSRTTETAHKDSVRIFRKKRRVGKVEKVIDDYTLLVKDLFKKERKTVILALTGNEGKIESSFGKSGKVRVVFNRGIKQNLQNDCPEVGDKLVNTEVILQFKKYLFSKEQAKKK